MNRRSLFTAILILVFSVSVLPALDMDQDYKVIKNAVKKNKRKGQEELTYFKVLVTDNSSKKTKVKITLPMALIDLIADCGDKRRFNLDDDCDIDLKAVLKALKQAGPQSLLEVYEDDVTVKIWFE